MRRATPGSSMAAMRRIARPQRGHRSASTHRWEGRTCGLPLFGPGRPASRAQRRLEGRSGLAPWHPPPSGRLLFFEWIWRMGPIRDPGDGYAHRLGPVPPGCRFRCWCRPMCNHMPLCAAICRSLERKWWVLPQARRLLPTWGSPVRARFRAPSFRSALGQLGRGRFRFGRSRIRPEKHREVCRRLWAFPRQRSQRKRGLTLPPAWRVHKS